MAGVEALFARIGAGFFQQAFVVDDLDAAMQAFTASIGCPQWTTFPTIGSPYRYRGRDIESSVSLAFGRSGKVQIELIQPLDGEGVTHDFLAEYGPGAHHLAFLVDSVDKEVAAAHDDGIDCVMSGHIGTLYYSYLDTFDTLGIYTEIVEDPDGLVAQLTPMNEGDAHASRGCRRSSPRQRTWPRRTHRPQRRAGAHASLLAVFDA